MPSYVISDLHIGAGPLDDCDTGCEDTLVAFINMLARRARTGAVELILNGDTFDFVQADPWRGADFESTTVDGVQLCFDEALSCKKAQSMVDAHPRIFDALNQLLAEPQARLTVLPGNHDADLFWPAVRSFLAERLGNPSGLSWQLERHYIPPTAPGVWIEHGHQYDPINNFFHPRTDPPAELWSPQRPPVLIGPDGRKRLMACIGTRFMLRFLNELDYRFPFVDNIKPFGRFLSIFASSADHLRGGTVRAALSALAFARFVATETVAAPQNLLGLPSWYDDLGNALAALEMATEGEFSRSLDDAGFNFQGRSFELLLKTPEDAERVLDFALTHLDQLDNVRIEEGMLSLDSGDGTLSLIKGFNVNETQVLKDAACDLLKKPGVGCVVMGHTHERVDSPQYKNTGSWTRYWEFKPGESTPSWPEMVRRQASLPLSPRYALIGEDPTQVVQLIDFS